MIYNIVLSIPFLKTIFYISIIYTKKGAANATPIFQHIFFHFK